MPMLLTTSDLLKVILAGQRRLQVRYDEEVDEQVGGPYHLQNLVSF
jgi:hypothetical protein